MTEKRFINVNHEIWQNGEWWCSAGGEHCADVIATAMNELIKENKQLKAQLYCNPDGGVCSICKHCYLDEQSLYYISKCKKGHEQCSKEDVKYCDDFEIKELKE